MNLTRLSLGVPKNITYNNYVKEGDCKNPPCLKLLTYRVSILLYEDYFIHVSKDLVNSSGTILSFLDDTSKYPITYIMQNCIQDKQNVQDFNDILILGALCESICKVAIPIEALTENAELVNQFIKQSFEYHKADTNDYQFDFCRALNLLIEESSEVKENIIKKSILLGRTSELAIYCKALLNVSPNLISIKDECKQNNGIYVPSSITSSGLSNKELNCLYHALIWILLGKSGFYLNPDGSFDTFVKAFDYRMPPDLFFDCTTFHPHAIIKIFDDNLK